MLGDLGRLASDLLLFYTSEFAYVTLPDEMTTGSSIMPQKRNPDVFELVRGSQATALGALQETLALTAKLTSGYHRDLQRLKAPLFRSIDLAGAVLAIMAHALPGVRFRAERIVLAPRALRGRARERARRQGRRAVPRGVPARRGRAGGGEKDMSRAARLTLAVAAALAAFASLAGCGQRGPLTLPESQRPIQRLDKGAAPAPTSAAPTPPTGAPGAGAPAEPPPDVAPGGTPRPEDDERPKG